MNKRIVITGLGVISSIGIGWRDFWDNLLKGKSGISPLLPLIPRTSSHTTAERSRISDRKTTSLQIN